TADEQMLECYIRGYRMPRGWGSTMIASKVSLVAIFAAALSVATGPGWAAPADDAQHAEALKKERRFDEIVEQIKSGKLDVNYTELRLDYPYTSTYDSGGSVFGPVFSDLWKAFKANNCDSALTKSNRILEINFIHSPTHFVRGDCFQVKGDPTHAEA